MAVLPDNAISLIADDEVDKTTWSGLRRVVRKREPLEANDCRSEARHIGERRFAVGAERRVGLHPTQYSRGAATRHTGVWTFRGAAGIVPEGHQRVAGGKRESAQPPERIARRSDRPGRGGRDACRCRPYRGGDRPSPWVRWRLSALATGYPLSAPPAQPSQRRGHAVQSHRWCRYAAHSTRRRPWENERPGFSGWLAGPLARDIGSMPCAPSALRTFNADAGLYFPRSPVQNRRTSR